MYYLREYLNEREDDCEALIVGKRAPYRLKPCGVRAVLKDIARRQGMSCKVYPHKFRKTLGMTLKNKGYDLGVIRRGIGAYQPGNNQQYYAESTSDTLRYQAASCVERRNILKRKGAIMKEMESPGSLRRACENEGVEAMARWHFRRRPYTVSKYPEQAGV